MVAALLEKLETPVPFGLSQALTTPMDIICASICYRGFADDEVAATLERAPEIGFQLMEIHGPILWSLEAVEAFDLPGVKDRVDASGLKCVGLTRSAGVARTMRTFEHEPVRSRSAWGSRRNWAAGTSPRRARRVAMNPARLAE